MNKKNLIISLLLALFLSLMQLLLFLSPLGERIEILTLEASFNLRGQVAAPDDIIILSMDESSYRVLDLQMDQAWPRSLHAEVLNRLKEYQAKRVVMDILFLGRSSDELADRQLAQSIALTPTVLAADLGSRQEVSSAGSFNLEELLEPEQVFSSQAETIALAKMPDDRGSVRRFFGPETELSKSIPKLFQAAIDKDFFRLNSDNPEIRDFINYYGPAGSIKSMPVHQFLNPKGAPAKEVFKDKIVFIGLNLRTEVGPAQKDAYMTPFYHGGRMFGVEIQATAAANMLDKNWIKRASVWSEGFLIFTLSLILMSLILILNPVWSSLTLVVAIGVWSLSAYLSFLNGHFLAGLNLCLIGLPICFLISVLIYYFRTYKMQKQSERAFQMYLSPEMTKMMRNDLNSLKLGGESVYATAMFTDIQNFTSITENMSATEVSAMLNAYFTEVMDVVFENKGTLIKFIGDAVFALWGAPIKEADHARLACQTAIRIQQEVQKFNQSKRFPALNTRIGINSGSMVVGNLGSAKRFDYTAIGDSVNLAARIEGINKYLGTSILISEYALKETNAKISALNMGRYLVVGKQQSVELYAIFDTDISSQIKSEWEKALVKFRNKNWTEALNLFQTIHDSEPCLSAAAAFYLSKINFLQLNSPEESWNGEINIESK